MKMHVMPTASRRVLSTFTTCSSRRAFATSSTLHESYGFIGLGRMGYPMARNLRNKIAASDKLFVHDVHTPASERFADEMKSFDVTVASSAREVAENATTIITVLPSPSEVNHVFLSMLKPPTLLTDAPVQQPRLFIDCSTIDPASSQAVANAAHSSGQGRFVDAPMSGGVVGAAAGKLTFMIGAADDLVARTTHILATMGARVLHLGPQTSGLKGKLANNYLLALNNLATAEAMHMGVRWGLDPRKLAAMINTATGRCWPSEVNNPVPGVVAAAPASRGYEGGFATALMLKDLTLALQAAADADVPPSRLGVAAREMYQAVEADPALKGKDFSVVYRYIGGE